MSFARRDCRAQLSKTVGDDPITACTTDQHPWSKAMNSGGNNSRQRHADDGDACDLQQASGVDMTD